MPNEDGGGLLEWEYVSSQMTGEQSENEGDFQKYWQEEWEVREEAVPSLTFRGWAV